MRPVLLVLCLTACVGASDDADKGGASPPATEAAPPSRFGLSNGTAPEAAGAYRLRLVVGDPISTTRSASGAYQLRLGLGTTQVPSE